MANKENQPPAPPQLSSISPGNRPALSRQRDHSACRHPDTPLRVRKTRDNLKQCSIYADVPPPCLHLHGPDSQPSCSGDVPGIHHNVPAPEYPQISGVATNELTRIQNLYQGDFPCPGPSTNSAPPVEGTVQRQRSVKQRMLSRVKQGIASRARTAQPCRPGESDSSLVRRFSGRRKKSAEAHSRAQSFEISRDSIDSQNDESFDSVASPVAADRSFSGTSVSTADILGDSSITTDTQTRTGLIADSPGEDGNGFYARAPSHNSPPSQLPAPRPPPRAEPPALPHEHSTAINVALPYIDLDVQMDVTALDIHAKMETWVAIRATVNVHRPSICLDNGSIASPAWNVDHPSGEPKLQRPRAGQEYVCGSISSLRLCYKPMGKCQIRAVLGQKTLKDLAIGQEAVLFIKLHVPRIRMADSVVDADTDSLFTDLESMVGTLGTDVLHVEARYRNSLLPSDNVLTVRHACTLKRPKTECRWSMPSSSEAMDISSSTHTRLAEYLAAHFAPHQALKLMHEHVDAEILKQTSVRELCTVLAEDSSQDTRCTDDDRPSVIVTDIDDGPAASQTDASDHFSTAPSTPVSSAPQYSAWLSTANHTSVPSSISLPISNTLAPPLLCAPKTTTSLSQSAPESSLSSNSNTIASAKSHDSARQLWRHLRRTSLSTRQLEEIAPAQVEHLEASDDTLRELRRKALANKRSVGAETLKDWKWEGEVQRACPGGEAPWM